MEVRHNAAKTAGISRAFLRLQKIQPSIFEEAVREFERYSMLVTVAVTSAPPESILVAQGHAQQCQAILQALRECHLTERPQQPGS